MTIQDYTLELSQDQSFTGASPNFLPYVASSGSIDTGSLENLLQDKGLGAELVMEFEVTEAFTGYEESNAIPHIVMGVCVADDAALTANVSIIGMVGWQLGSTKVEFGLQPSDSQVVPNLYLGDRYYCKINPGVIGLPWIGSGGVRQDKITPPTSVSGLVPWRRYLGAYYILPMRTGQAVQMSNPALWTATNFTAGKLSTRILINQPISDGKHHYASGMKVV